MPTLAEIREQYPQYQDMPDSALADALHRKFYSDIPQADFYGKIGFQPPSVAADVAKSGGIGVAEGAIGLAGLPGDIAEYGARGIDWATRKIGGALGVDVKPREARAPTYGSADIKKGVESVTGEFYQPKTTAGEYARAVGQMVPASAIGPGGVALKAGGAVLSGVGSEAAGQATKGTAYEGPARIAGAVAGGVGAAKMLGPSAPKAAIPTGDELIGIGKTGYKAAGKAGLELDPRGTAAWAQWAQQNRHANNFTGRQAPETFKVLDDLQRPPPGSTITSANIDALRQDLRDIAGKVEAAPGGAFKPTRDAAAATQTLKDLERYTQNIPRGHIVAGDAATYVRETKRADANYAAGSRTRDFDARLTKAERTADRQISGSLDNQIKAKAGQMLDRGARGLSAAERAQLELINSGTKGSEVLRQLGRGGAGVVPIGAQVLTGIATGGASLPYQIPLAAALYGARKGSEAITKNRAQKLAEMLAKRSPEYEQRVAALPPTPGNAPNVAALVRALLGSN